MLNLGHSKRKKKDSSKADQDRAERAKARRKKKLNETKAEIEEKKLRLNDEGTQACNISFMPLSGGQGLSTEKTREMEEIYVSFADRNFAENDKSCQTEVKSLGEMCTQNDVLRRKLYDASSQTGDFDYLFTSILRLIFSRIQN